MLEVPPCCPFESEFAREHYARGWAQAYAKGQAKAIFKMLLRRGFTPSAEQRERVLACRDPAVLDVWAGRVLFAPGLDEFFAD